MLANAAAANVFIVTNVISIVIDIAATAAAAYRPFADAAAAPIGGPPASPAWG